MNQNLEVLDIRTVHHMFEQIKTCIENLQSAHRKQLAVLKKDLQSTDGKSLSELKKEVSAHTQQELNKMSTKLKEDMQKQLCSKIDREISSAMEFYNKQVEELQCQLNDQKLKQQISANVICYSNQLIEDLAARLDSVELNQAKKQAILTGLDFSDKKADRNAQITSFFEDTLEISAEIEDSYTLGTKSPKPVVITFASVLEKNRIFEVKGLLKDIENGHGAAIYLNEYLPQSINEKRRREKEIIKMAKKDPSIKTDPEFLYLGLFCHFDYFLFSSSLFVDALWKI